MQAMGFSSAFLGRRGRLGCHRFRTGLAAVLLAGAVAFGSARPAAAQGGGGPNFGIAEINTPEFSRRDLPIIVDVLELDAAQQDIVEVFLDGYTEAFTKLREEAQNELDFMREEMQNARRADGSGFDWRDMVEEMMSRMEGYRDRRDVLGYEFVANVQSMLSEQQMERWPKFERTMRRQQLVPKGMLSGESVDLFQIVATGGLTEADHLTIEPVLSEYELQLDAALLARESDMEKAEEAFRDAVRAFGAGELDVKDVLSAVERQRKLRVRIRDVNEMYVSQIVAILPDAESAARFQATYKEAAYPRIYRETYGEEALAAAINLPDLDENVRVSIEGVADAYEARLAQFNEKIERITREEEPRQAEKWITMMASRMSGGDAGRPEDPIREAFEEREEYEDQVVGQLRAMLTEDQARQLPRRSQRPEGDGRFREGTGVGFPGGGGFRGRGG